MAILHLHRAFHYPFTSVMPDLGLRASLCWLLNNYVIKYNMLLHDMNL